MNSFACSSPSPAMLVELSRRMKVLRPCPIESEHSVAVDKSLFLLFKRLLPYRSFFIISKFDVFRLLINHLLIISIYLSVFLLQLTGLSLHCPLCKIRNGVKKLLIYPSFVTLEIKTYLNCTELISYTPNISAHLTQN